MSIAEFINDIAAQGVYLSVVDGKLKSRAEKGKLTDAIRSQIKLRREEVMDYFLASQNKGLVQIEKRPQDSDTLASFAQQRLWFIDQLEGGSSQYNIPSAFIIEGELDLALVEAALQQICSRHEVLRTVFEQRNGEVYQKPMAQARLSVEMLDLSEQADSEQKLQALAFEDAKKPFDLAQDLLLRATVVKLAEARHGILLNMHHIAADGWSVNIFIKEFCLLYANPGKTEMLPELAVQYADYSHWQRKNMSSESYGKKLDYWLERLHGLPQVHNLPLDKKRPLTQTVNGAMVHKDLSLSLSDKLMSLCQAKDITPFMLLQTAFAVLIGRYSNELDVVMGSPSAGRLSEDLEPVIGFFINMLVLRTEMDGQQSFEQLLQQNKQHILNAFSHQEVAFDQLVEKLNPQRVLSYNPLIQILFSLHNNEKSTLDINGLTLSPLGEDVAQSQYDIELNISEKQGQYSCSWRYNTDLFEGPSVERMAQNFVHLLEQVIGDPEVVISQIDMVGQSEKQQLLKLGGVAQIQAQSGPDFLTQFEAIAAEQPELIACECHGETLSYGELNARANQVARFLHKAGSGGGDLVGLFVSRGIELMLGVIGVLKSGAGYVPLDPSLPIERIEYMVEDAEISVILTESEYIEELSFDDVRLLPLDGQMLELMVSRFEQDNISADEAKINPDNTAYVIYTSGSTGKPKGVAVSHSNLQHYLSHAKADYMSACRCAVVSTGIGFDATVTSMLTPLVCGGTVELVTNSLDEMATLATVIKSATEAKLFKLTPAHLNALQYYLKDFSSDLAHCLVVGGEKLSLQISQLWLQQLLPDACLINEYGPTEATVGCTIERVTLADCQNNSGQFASIGKPIVDTAILILDEQQNLVPQGVIGEIYIGGAGVALGYHNQPQLSAEKFIAAPDELPLAGSIYRTGDLARWCVDGRLEFIDRVDGQVKVRGYRIELGEIENQLQSLADVDGAVVDICEDEQGDSRLVAYVIYRSDNENEDEQELEDTAITAQLRALLMSKLPDYMVPDLFLLIDKIPLTANGKVDRNALPKPDGELLVQAQAYMPPGTETQHQLVTIWSGLLGLDEQSIGINTSFFNLGGHSLLVIRFVSEVRDVFAKELEVKEIFDSPTISELSVLLDRMEAQTEGAEVRQKVMPRSTDATQLPLSYAQQRLWFIDRLDGGSAQFNMPLAFRVTGGLNLEHVESAFDAIVQRHEVLRTVLVEVDGEPRQEVREGVRFKLSRFDLSELTESARQQAVARLIEQDRSTCFDLSQDLMLRAGYILLGTEGQAQTGVLMFNMHHIASDGWSKGVLVDEFMQLYQALIENRPIELPPLAIQYADYALWQRQWLDEQQLQSQLDYWSENLAGVPMLHELEPDFPRPEQKNHVGQVYSSHLGADIAAKLQQQAKQHQLTPFMLLHGVLAQLFSRHSNSHDIVIGTPVANRLQSELESLIGFFVNTLVLRINTEHCDWGQYLSHVREVHLNAQANQDVPFEQLVEHLNAPRNPAFTPLYQLMFTINTNEQKPLALDGLTFNALDSEQEAVKVDLDINGRIDDNGIAFSWVYDGQLFSKERIIMLAEHFNRMLEGVANGVTQVPGLLPMLSDEQTTQMLNLAGSGQTEPLPCDNLHQWVEHSAERSPQKVALVHQDRNGQQHTLTYEQFNAQANQLARALIAEGVVADTPVGLMMERNCELLVAMVAIGKAGGAYVPIDHEMPQSRVSHIIADTKMPILLMSERFADLIGDVDVKPVAVDSFFNSGACESHLSDNLELALCKDNLAYIIYTSGTTGQPKGVLINQRSAVNSINQGAQRYLLDQQSINLSHMSVSFDAGSLSIWSTFVNGSCLHIIDPLECSGEKLQDYINDKQVTHLISTPALVSDIQPQYLPSLQVLVVGGSQMAAAEIAVWAANCRIFNSYGPTESCMFSITKELHADETIELGEAIANTCLYVLDSNLQPVPPGAVGVLYIGGIGLARGYLNQAQLTAEKFILNPFTQDKGDKIYNTGDLVRVGRQGELQFIGRNDQQVKVRGLRIELGEIQSQLFSCDNVANAVVILDDAQRLAAYVVAQTPVADEAEFFAELQQELNLVLPQYMVPSAWQLLAQLPLTLNGKIDVARLPKIAKQQGYRAAQTPTQKTLCQLWQTLLQVEPVGLDDNFFELGGHSLLMVRLISDIRSALSVELPLRSVFEYPSIVTLAEYIDNQRSSLRTLPPITKVSRDQVLPLSHSQQRLWFIDKLEGSSSHYNMPAAFRLKGALDVTAFERTLQAIIERHEVLRTTLVEQQGVASQQIAEHFDVPLTQLDLTELSQGQRDEKVDELMRDDALAPFDLSQDLMLRSTLIRVAEDEHVVLFNMHHIASDGWSMGILVGEFGQLYNAFAKAQANPLAPLAIQFADFALWQREQLSESELASQMQYWREQLEQVKPLHSLPGVGPRPAEQDFAGRRYAQRISSELTAKINDFCAENDVSTFMFIQTCMSIVFARYSNEHDIVMGSPIAGRPYREVEQLIGFFLNTLVLRSDLSKNQSFSAQLSQNKDMILDAYSHQLVPFEMLVEQLSPQRSLSYNPMVQVLLNVFETVSGNDLELSDIFVSKLEPLGEQNISLPKADMIVYVRPNNSGLSIQWDHRTSIFAERIIAQMASSLEAIIKQVIEAPQQHIFDLKLADDDVQQDWFEHYYQPLQTSNEQPLMLEMFREAVAEFGDDTALVHQFNSKTFEELDEESEQLARYLVTNGLAKGDTVGLLCRRGIELYIGLLATLKAGGVYVPLMPELPDERINYIVKDAGIRFVLTEQNGASRVPDSIECIALDQALPEAALDHVELPQLNEADGSHIIYTSGSTGQPKGVLGTHGALANRIGWMHNEFPYDPEEDVACQITASGFIRAVWEMLTPIAKGVQVVILDTDEVKDAHRFVEKMALHSITRVVSAPSFANAIAAMDEDQLEQLCELRYWFISGEPLKPALANRLLAALEDTTFCNLYGSTEVMSDVSYYVIDQPLERLRVPIGRAIDNTSLLILDKGQQLVPTGVPGEICITGTALAKGYLNNPQLTDEKFATIELAGQSLRVYRTGDMGVMNQDGNVECLGRQDNQLKLRGYRIELEEIESRLSHCDSVKQAVVLLHGRDEQTDNEGYLVAHVLVDESALMQSSAADIESQCREYLIAYIPDYMMPSRINVLSRYPLLHNGKVDRKALLRDFETNTDSSHYCAPTTAVEIQLSEIWQEVLQKEQVGIHDDFFALGGHSLLAIRLISRIRQAFEVELTPRVLFEYPTIAQLTEAMFDEQYSETIAPIVALPKGTEVPLSFAQQRLWFINSLEEQSAQYNMPKAFAIEGDFDLAACEKALDALVARHDILRTRFVQTEGKVLQIVDEGFAPKLVKVDLSAEPDPQAQAQQAIKAHAAKCFDLAGEPLLDMRLLKLTQETHVMLFNMHHIASDGWSMGILSDEFSLLYQAFCQGKDNPLMPLSIQYADYAQWQRDWMSGEALETQLQYWRTQLQQLPQLHKLPLDNARPQHNAYRGGQTRQRIDGELYSRLSDFCQSRQVTMFMLMHSVLSVLFSRYSNENDIVMGTPVAGRPLKELEPIVGLFVNTLVLRSQIAPNAGFDVLLETNKKMILDAYQHQFLPFEALVEDLKPERHINYNPLFQIMFSMHSDQGSVESSDLQMRNVGTSNGTSKFDLSIDMEERDGQVLIEWGFDLELFLPQSIDQMSANFLVLLDDILTQPQQSVNRLKLLGQAAIDKQLVEFNGKQVEYPGAKTFSQRFAQTVERFADATAVVHNDVSLSYEQLDERSNRLAHYLKAQGVVANTLVGIYAYRSPAVLTAMLAVLKAGGAFVSIDPINPQQRIDYMLSDSQVGILLSETALIDGLNANADLTTFDLNEMDTELTLYAPQALPCINDENDPAYMIYTSGSTGQPKGALVHHSGALNHIDGEFDIMGFMDADLQLKPLNFLQSAAASSDISVWQFLAPVMSGGKTVILDDMTDMTALCHQVCTHKVDIIELVPVIIARMLDHVEDPAVDKGQLECLSWLMITGDATPVGMVNRWFELFPHIPVLNGYGPTEASDDVSYHIIRQPLPLQCSNIPIGKPLANMALYVLSEHLQLQPLGAVGEICVSGVGVGKGYWRKPEKTAEVFVDNPYAEPSGHGATLYRTGDLGRWLANGELEMLGRIDNQVKVRGFRIELGEIEAALADLSYVNDAAVIICQDEQGEDFLAAYLTAAAHCDIEIRALRKQMADKLPGYMVPSTFSVLPKMPLNSTGKIDRLALPKPEKTSNIVYRAPATENEIKLCEVWQQVLQKDKVGIDDNFFDIGGHSLQMLEIKGRLNAADIAVDVMDFYRHQSIADLAEYIDNVQVGSENEGCGFFMTTSKADKVLFALHPQGGHVASMMTLAKGLEPHCRVYGLEAPDLHSDWQTGSIEALVEYHLQQILKVQSSGPFYLTGWSSGGKLAYHIAVRLQQMGHEIGNLSILDTSPNLPALESQLAEKAWFEPVLAMLDERLVVDTAELSTLDVAQGIDYLVEQSITQGLCPVEEKTRALRTIRYLHNIDKAFDLYRSVQSNLALDLYRLDKPTSQFDVNKVNEQADYGWSDFTSGEVKIIAATGSHSTMLNAPFVDDLIARMSARLAV